MSIKCEVISDDLIVQLDFVFGNYIVKDLMSRGMWIAGGFARKIGHIILGLNKDYVNSSDSVLKYFSHIKTGDLPGDIDFFCSNPEKFDYKKLAMKSNSPIVPSISQTKFANNIIIATNSKSIYKKQKQKLVKLQLINKFVYKSARECLYDFDITNCKYAIIKKDRHYVLMYDSKALYYDSLKEIHLNKSNSPYTINRIIKYINKRDLNTISKDKQSIEVFRECLYNVIANCWDNKFNLQVHGLSSIKSCIVALNKKKLLSEFEISMFIGHIKYMNIKKEKFDEDYGDYIYSYNIVDWATHIISTRVN